MGVEVLDCSQSLSGAFCAATLERMGAQVVHLDFLGVPAGTESAFLDSWLRDSEMYRDYLGRSGENHRIDLSEATGRDALRELASRADVILEDSRQPLLLTAGIDVASFHNGRPAPIVASVTPHGRSGPRRDDLASDLTLFHGAGPGHAVPGLVADPRTMGPLRLGSHQGLMVGGLVAAINVVAAVFARSRQPAAVVTVDVSCHEALVNSYRQSLGTFAYYGGGMGRDLAFGRGAGGMVDHRNLKCKNGYFNIAWGGVQQWDSLKGLLGNPEWMEDQDLATPAQRYRNWVRIVPRLEEWTAEFEKEHLLYLCQGWRIPCAPVNEGVDVLAQDVLEFRGFWRSEPVDGGPIAMPGLPSRREYPALPAESN